MKKLVLLSAFILLVSMVFAQTAKNELEMAQDISLVCV